MANIVRAPCDAGAIMAGRHHRSHPASIGTWVLVATILGSSLAFIDGSIANLALPALQRDLHATVVDAQWVIEAYALFLSALILVGGSLGDQFGRRRVFMAGIALFALASISCGLAQSVPQLIVSRAVQGTGGALLTPGSLAIISATFSNAERGRAIGTWSGFSAVTGVLGPVAGGFLIQHASWRWAFLLNVPLSAVVLFICWWRVPESRDPEASRHLDWLGAGLCTIGLGALVYGLIRSQTDGITSPVVLAVIAAGVAALTLFGLVEARERHPMMPLNLFRSRVFSGTNALTLLLYGALAGSLFFLPLDLLEVQGYSATVAGAALLPAILLISVLSRWTGGLVERYGARPPLVVGPTIGALGFALFSMAGTNANYWTSFFPASVVLGIGMAITVAPLTTAVMGSVEPAHAGTASGINNAVARTAGLMAVAVLGLIFVQAFNSGLHDRLANQELQPQTRQAVEAQRYKLALADVPADAPPAVRGEVRRDLNEAFVGGFRLVTMVAAGMALAGALIGFLVIGTAPRAEPAPAPARAVT